MNHSLRRIIPVTFAFILFAGSASAALSPKYDEWREGPVQWIMTRDEQKDWKKVANDDEAVAFIDLFWARRDPSAGTPENPYRNEFLGRVKFADENFAQDNERGALTDRGRVYITLGNPTKWNVQVRNSNSADAGTQGMTEGGSRLRAAKDTWLWEGADARKYDRPKIEVVFIQKVGTDRKMRDPHRPDFMSAGPAAIEKSLVNKDLKVLPDWAARGGLEPVMIVERPAPAAPVETATVAFPETAPASPATPAVVDSADPADATLPAGSRGASRLTLLQNVYDIDTETGSDPFESMESSDVFASTEELGWATQYCAPGVDDPLVRFALHLTGTAENEVIDRAAPPDEMVPDRIRIRPGCFMLRGAIPLEGMSAGSYELEVALLDSNDNTLQTLKRAFRIE